MSAALKVDLPPVAIAHHSSAAGHASAEVDATVPGSIQA
jgi:hypothetical protein